MQSQKQSAGGPVAFQESIVPGFGYMRAKAAAFIEKGPEAYREADFFDQPPADTPDELLERLRSACEQLVDGAGESGDKPLEHIGIEAFYSLMQMLHFNPGFSTRKTHYLDEGIMDEMDFKHEVDGVIVTVFNLVRSEDY